MRCETRTSEAPTPLILAVDDDPLVLRMMARMFDVAHFDTVCCRSVVEALEAMQRRRFHAAVSDVGMPGVSGMELLRCARQMTPELPVIIVSGGGAEEQQARDLGAFGYLLKPLNIDELLALVRRAARLDPTAIHTPPCPIH